MFPQGGLFGSVRQGGAQGGLAALLRQKLMLDQFFGGLSGVGVGAGGADGQPQNMQPGGPPQMTPLASTMGPAQMGAPMGPGPGQQPQPPQMGPPMSLPSMPPPPAGQGGIFGAIPPGAGQDFTPRLRPPMGNEEMGSLVDVRGAPNPAGLYQASAETDDEDEEAPNEGARARAVLGKINRGEPLTEDEEAVWRGMRIGDSDTAWDERDKRYREKLAGNGPKSDDPLSYENNPHHPCRAPQEWLRKGMVGGGEEYFLNSVTGQKIPARNFPKCT